MNCTSYIPTIPNLLLTIAIVITLPCMSQKVEATFKMLPVRDGTLYRLSYVGSCFANSDGIFLTSNNDSIFATAAGVITSLYDLDDGELAVTVKCNGKFITYASKTCFNVSSGDTIKAGDFIGRMIKNDAQEFELVYLVLNSKGDFLSRQQLIDHLKQVNQQFNSFSSGPYLSKVAAHVNTSNFNCSPTTNQFSHP